MRRIRLHHAPTNDTLHSMFPDVVTDPFCDSCYGIWFEMALDQACALEPLQDRACLAVFLGQELSQTMKACDDGNFIDGVEHRLFRCRKWEQLRMSYAPRLREIFADYLEEYVSNTELVKASFCWNVMVAQNHTVLPGTVPLDRFITPPEEMREKLADLFHDYLLRSGISKVMTRPAGAYYRAKVY